MHARARGRSPKAPKAYLFLSIVYLWKGLQGWRSIFIMVCALIIQVWIRPLQADLMSTGAQTQDIDTAAVPTPLLPERACLPRSLFTSWRPLWLGHMAAPHHSIGLTCRSHCRIYYRKQQPWPCQTAPCQSWPLLLYRKPHKARRCFRVRRSQLSPRSTHRQRQPPWPYHTLPGQSLPFP